MGQVIQEQLTELSETTGTDRADSSETSVAQMNETHSGIELGSNVRGGKSRTTHLSNRARLRTHEGKYGKLRGGVEEQNTAPTQHDCLMRIGMIRQAKQDSREKIVQNRVRGTMCGDR